jgi:iron complex outermembrane receptor protein
MLNSRMISSRMIKRYKYAMSPLLGLSVGLSLFAPVIKAQAQEVLETLIVSGERSAPVLASQVIVNTQADFPPGARLDPAELLQGLPGIQVDSRSNYAQDTRISLRGFGARSAFGVRGIDLYVDGIPMSTPDGQGQLSSVMLDSVSSAQVLRGPIAALYGNGAGGVIALQTAAPQTSQLSIGAVAGDPGLERQTLQGDWRQGGIAARVQLANTNIDGERPHSQAERRQGAAQFYYSTANQLNITLKHERSDDPLLQDPLSLRPQEWRDNPRQTNAMAEQFNTRKSVEHEQTSLSLSDNTGPTRWQAAAWQGERAITQYLGFSGADISGSGGVVDLMRDFAGASGTLTRYFSLFSLPADISLGVEVAQTEDRRRGYVNNNGVAGDLRRNELGSVDSRDLHALLQVEPLADVTLYAGVRQIRLDMEVDDYFIVEGNPDDSGSRNYRENAYAFGANYQVTERWELFASRGRGFETPTLTEMAYRRQGSGLNVDLAAAINHQQEWGFRYSPVANAELLVTYFAIDSQNELVVDQSVGGRTSYRNATETEREGVELLGRYQLGDHWRVQASAQLLEAKYSAGELSSKHLPGVAREQYQLGLQWLPFGSETLILGATAQQRARVFADDDNSVAAPAFHTLDLSAQGDYHWSALHLGWWLKVVNLSDENYVGSVVVNQSNGRAFEPALGRNLVLGVKVQHEF